jgi:cell wall-associated NlpC family hydrolase
MGRNMSKKETFNRYIKSAAEAARKMNKNTRIMVLLGVAVCFILSTAFAMTSGTEVYGLTIAGKDAGYITNAAVIDEAVKEITADYAGGNIPMEVSVDREQVKVEKTDLEKEKVTVLSAKQLEKEMIDAGVCTVKAWALNVNGKNIAAAASKEVADQILSGVKGRYLSSGSKLISAEFKENVSVTQAAVSVTNVMTTGDAINLILTGEKSPEVYTVKAGDTIWDIAALKGISVTDLQKENPGFDPNKIQIGQQLSLSAVKPFVTVVTKELVNSTEKIAFNTVYENSNSLYKGETKIKTPGVNGTKEVSSEVTKENGAVTAVKVVNSVVTAEPVNQVALKGTKAKATVQYAVRRGGSGARSASVAASGSDIVAYAKKFIGVPYVHGGATPDGFDCSGYTQYVMGYFGGALPRTTSGQYASGTRVSKSELQPGDLVFFKPSAGSSSISHVGIYVGGGNYIHAPQPGERVKISDLNDRWGANHYYGAARVTR